MNHDDNAKGSSDIDHQRRVYRWSQCKPAMQESLELMCPRLLYQSQCRF
jgi:hypothetical protein